jgi:hypothetical protein
MGAQRPALSGPRPYSPTEGGTPLDTRVDLPASEDPMALLAALVLRLREVYEVEVQGYDIDPDGSVKVDFRVRP